jgi:hypothetical protein
METEKKKLLSSKDALAGIERQRDIMADSLGNKDAWLEAHREHEYFTAALVDAEQREAEEAEARRCAEIEAKKPAALQAAKESSLEYALASERDYVRQAIELLCSVAKRCAEKRPAIYAKQLEARRLCEEVRIPFLVDGPLTDHVVREHLRGVIHRTMQDACIEDDGCDYFGPIRILAKVHP